MLICFKIFVSRIIDVSLGTLRTIFTIRGKTFLASFIAFFEVFIWFVIAREALNTTIDSIMIPVFYALGYAIGTCLGSYISNNYIESVICFQIIIHKNNINLINMLRKNNYRISQIELSNTYDGIDKIMLFIKTGSKKRKELINIIKKYDHNAFIVYNETKTI